MKYMLIFSTIFFALNGPAQTTDEYGYDPVLLEDEIMRQEAGYDTEYYSQEAHDVYYEEDQMQEAPPEEYYPEYEDMPGEEY